jgi:hypothetical protein
MGILTSLVKKRALFLAESSSGEGVKQRAKNGQEEVSDSCAKNGDPGSGQTAVPRSEML